MCCYYCFKCRCKKSETLFIKLVEEYKELGLKLNWNKTELINSYTEEDIRIGNKVINSVNKFKRLGSILEYNKASTAEIENRIRNARKTIQFCGTKMFFIEQKRYIYQAIVQSILLYIAENWVISKRQANKLMGFWRRSTKKIKKRQNSKVNNKKNNKCKKDHFGSNWRRTIMLIWLCETYARLQCT